MEKELLEKMLSAIPPVEAVNRQAGDSNKITRDFYDSLMISYRHIGGKIPELYMELLGKSFDTPVMVGGMAAAVPMMHEGGMAEIARGAKEAGAVFWSGYVEDEEFAAAVSTGAAAVRIIKPMQDEERILKAIAHDEECGAFAWAMDIDHGFDDDGTFLHREHSPYGDLEPKSIEQLKEYIQSTKLPFFAKGILNPQDALDCVQAGAKGIVLSHHKGEYQYALPPAMVLPDIRKAVGDDIYIFVDCGIQSGFDAFKALALGANGVCVARPLMKPFAEQGANGVCMKLQSITGELAGVMARTGSSDVRHINRSVLYTRTF